MEFKDLSDLEVLCFGVATHAYASVQHRRKYGKEPYIVHPWAVAELVKSVGGTEIMVSAAFLHDVLEDVPKYDRHELIWTLLEGVDGWKSRFEGQDENWEGKCRQVVDLVQWLTDPATKEDGNRETRIAINLKHIAAAPVEAKTIKLADMIDNTASIIRDDPTFAIRYMAEKKDALPLLAEGHPHLFSRCSEQVRQYDTMRLQEDLRQKALRQ
jgi:(p)ppGpp synthase/HD superfamily hydrolase